MNTLYRSLDFSNSNHNNDEATSTTTPSALRSRSKIFSCLLISVTAMISIFELSQLMKRFPTVTKHYETVIEQTVSYCYNASALSRLKDVFDIEWSSSNHTGDTDVSAESVYVDFIKPLHSSWALFLKENSLNDGVGHSGQIAEESTFYIEQIQQAVRSKKQHENVLVCEIGYNLGHSALTYLLGAEGISERTQVYTHYLGFSHPYPNHQVIAQVMKDTFGFAERFTVLWGDSTQLLPKYIDTTAKRNQLHQCDILVIDGGHTEEVATADLYNMKHLAKRKHHILIMDDLNCTTEWCVGTQIAWDKAKHDSTISELGCHSVEQGKQGKRGWCWGKYNL